MKYYDQDTLIRIMFVAGFAVSFLILVIYTSEVTSYPHAVPHIANKVQENSKASVEVQKPTAKETNADKINKPPEIVKAPPQPVPPKETKEEVKPTEAKVNPPPPPPPPKEEPKPKEVKKPKPAPPKKCVILYYTMFYRWKWHGDEVLSGDVSETSLDW